MPGLPSAWAHALNFLAIGVLGGFFLVPLNSDFDLYSMGPDGESEPPLSRPVSRDDIIVANDGDFIGIAKDY